MVMIRPRSRSTSMARRIVLYATPYSVATWTDLGNYCTLRDDELGSLLDQLDKLDLPG